MDAPVQGIEKGCARGRQLRASAEDGGFAPASPLLNRAPRTNTRFDIDTRIHHADCVDDVIERLLTQRLRQILPSQLSGPRREGFSRCLHV